MEKNKIAALENMSLFALCASETIKTVAELPVMTHIKGTYLPRAGELVILLWGKARVNRHEGAKTVLLNRLSEGNCFGFAGLYSDSLPDTEIVFSANTAIIVIPRETVEHLIMNDAAFARNIIATLSRKVRFLNGKIAGYTAKDGGEKLYRHMVSLPTDAEGCAVLGESMASLSRRLDMGRASLYRAINALMAEGKLQKIGQKYKVVVHINKEES